MAISHKTEQNIRICLCRVDALQIATFSFRLKTAQTKRCAKRSVWTGLGRVDRPLQQTDQSFLQTSSAEVSSQDCRRLCLITCLAFARALLYLLKFSSVGDLLNCLKHFRRSFRAAEHSSDHQETWRLFGEPEDFGMLRSADVIILDVGKYGPMHSSDRLVIENDRCHFIPQSRNHVTPPIRMAGTPRAMVCIEITNHQERRRELAVDIT
ncbi:hypothetical protein J6590_088813 [Homalodisca vitripennis]|nr:hypothetical protein J6590_088813 [Homalodisca vitripennis]